MAAIANLNDLLLHELSDIYSAEEQILEALPKLIEACQSADLAKAFKDHMKETQQHKARLDKVFGLLKAKPSGETCTAMKGILAEGGKLLKGKDKPDVSVLDAALIAAAQRVEHYEIAAYGCARTYCRLLGQSECETLLQQTLDEEGHADRLLTELALTGINRMAQAGQAQA